MAPDLHARDKSHQEIPQKSLNSPHNPGLGTGDAAPRDTSVTETPGVWGPHKHPSSSPTPVTAHRQSHSLSQLTSPHPTAVKNTSFSCSSLVTPCVQSKIQQSPVWKNMSQQLLLQECREQPSWHILEQDT